MEYVTLNNGVKMPKVGYGVYLVPPEDAKKCVLDAISVGYRSIDSAQTYKNEEGVGDAVAECGIARDELFITTKIWITNGGYEKAKASIEESMKKLRTDYIDLLLVHQPFNDYYGTYRAMEEAYREGKVRAIGVSNFYVDRFIDISKFCEIQPMVNQIELHPYYQRKTAREYAKKYNTQIESWGPLAQGRNNFFDEPVLKEIGEKYGKSIAQVSLRFLLQNDVVVIPKTTHIERMKENLEVFDFELSDEDMKRIEKLDRGRGNSMPHYDPERAEMFVNLP
ncbi:MAG: aldo/keto reductase [Firmicutes bacterium]|nr:aldo/keto reductase [Bacillota bacterium]